MVTGSPAPAGFPAPSRLRRLPSPPAHPEVPVPARAALTLPRGSAPAPRFSASLPARLPNPGDLAPQRHLTEADTADAELPKVCPRPPAALAPVVMPHPELRLLPGPFDQSLSRHNLSLSDACARIRFHSPPTTTGVSPRKGMPISRSSAIASSSRWAVVAITISIPWILSTLSYSISGKINCSLIPSV